jgi:anti-sigma regulatory factor (Ser/Thr protein kinase)
MTATRSFRCQPEAVTAARRFVRDVLSDQSLEVVQAAELMTSELATNCVRHARTDFELSVHSRDEIRIEVRDTGRGRPRPLSPAPQDPSGRGLLIVEAMSERWGVIPASSGKTVWFTLPKPETSSESSRSAAARRRGSGEDDRPGQAGSGEGSGRRGRRQGAPRATVRGRLRLHAWQDGEAADERLVGAQHAPCRLTRRAPPTRGPAAS